MAGIPHNLFLAIRQALLNCDELRSVTQLRALFAVAELQLWQHGLPEADNLRARVDLLLDYLHDRQNSRGEYALVLLLRILSMRYDVADARQHELVDLTLQLEASLAGKTSDRQDTQLSGIQRQILEQTYATLQDEFALRLEKTRRLRGALALETDVLRTFQLEQQLVDEQVRLNQVETEMQALEQRLR